MKLKHAQAGHAALQELIAADKASKFTFKFTSRIRLASNLHRVRPLIEAYNEQVARLVKDMKTATTSEDKISVPVTIKNAAGKDEANAELKSFVAAQTEMLEGEHDFKFECLTYEELGENQIPFDLLADLMRAGIITPPTTAVIP